MSSKDYNWLDTPVFIVGHPKSGTSLLVSLLDGHPELVVIPEETDFYPVIYQYLRWVDFKNMSVEDAVSIIEKIVYERTHLRYLLSRSKGEYIGGNYDYHEFQTEVFIENFRNYMLSHPVEYSTILRGIAIAFKEASPLDKVKSNIVAWVEKTPRHEFFAETFSNWFARAKFIHIVRDPRDNWTSYKRKHPNLRMLQFVISYNASLKAGLNNKKLFYKNYMILKYESLLSDPLYVMREVADFIGIKFLDILLKPSKLGFEWAGNSMWGEKYFQISKSPIGRYKKVLSEKEIFYLECNINFPFDKKWYNREKQCSAIHRFLNSLIRFAYSIYINTQVRFRKIRFYITSPLKKYNEYKS